MKEIKYNGNFKKSIDDANSDFNFSYEFGSRLLNIFSVNVLLIISVLLINLISFSLSNLLKIFLVCAAVEIPLEIGFTLYTKKRYINDKKMADKNLDEVIESLNQNEISVEKEQLQEALLLSEETKKVDIDDEELVKIIYYFYLLDKNEQLQVLKEIRKVISENEQYEEQLFLLEPNEIKSIEIPVEKTLKFK